MLIFDKFELTLAEALTQLQQEDKWYAEIIDESTQDIAHSNLIEIGVEGMEIDVNKDDKSMKVNIIL